MDFNLVEDDDAHDVIAAEHRNAQLGADGICVAQRIAVFRVTLEIRNVNRAPLECDSRRGAVAPWRNGMALDEVDELGGDVVEGRPAVRVTVPSHDDPTP